VGERCIWMVVAYYLFFLMDRFRVVLCGFESSLFLRYYGMKSLLFNVMTLFGGIFF